MMTNIMRKTGTGLVKSLHELVCDDDSDKAESMLLEEVYSYLKKNNIAHDQVMADVRTRLNKMTAKAQLDEASAKRVSFLEKLNGVIPSPVGIKENIRGLIDKMMSDQPQLASAYYRKYEAATENDLESLLQDLLALQQLDKSNADK